MKTLRHRFNEWLAVTGFVGLALAAIPVFAILVFVLRAALLVVAAAGLVIGVTLWLASARFRLWLGSWIDTEVTYKGLRLATDVAVHPGHAWVRRDGAHVMVGADDLLPAILGPVERVELPQPGRQVARGDVLFRLRRGDRVIEVQAPVDGTVVSGNAALTREPGLVNEDPFRRGWAVTLRGSPAAVRDWTGLRLGREATVWFRTEVDRLLAMVQNDGTALPAMADGGVVAGDLYLHIDDGTWRRVTEALGRQS